LRSSSRGWMVGMGTRGRRSSRRRSHRTEAQGRQHRCGRRSRAGIRYRRRAGTFFSASLGAAGAAPMGGMQTARVTRLVRINTRHRTRR
jgi:hypothetical protein